MSAKLETIWDKLDYDLEHMTSMYNHARKTKKYYDAVLLKNIIGYIEILQRYKVESIQK